MASKQLPNTDLKDPEARLKQYLYVGKEYANYQPGNWFVHNYFMVANLPAIQELAEIPEKELMPVKIILEAFESNLVPNPETLVFALAVCCRQTKSLPLRQEALSALHKICANPQHFILFIKFYTKLSKENELEPASTGGWGHGIRKAVNNWYLSKEPLELAKCVTRYRGRYGWKHKDIVKLSHPKATDQEKQMVLKYIIHGLEEAKKSFGEEPNEILSYLTEVEDFKHCDDEDRAARLLEMHKFTLDHVPGHLLKSKEVWTALISTMDLVTLLNNLQRIQNLGLLTVQSPAVAKLIDEITDAEKIARDKVHPALVLITLNNYEASEKPLTYEKRKIREQAKKLHIRTHYPNTYVIEALDKMLDLSFAHLQPTGLRYMVTIKAHKLIRTEGSVWHNGNLIITEVGCLIALSLLRCEKNVTVATFANNGVHIVELASTVPFRDAVRKLRDAPSEGVNLSKPLLWATNENKMFDVFINVVEQIHDKSRAAEKAFAAYRKKTKLQNAKLINCAVCSPSTCRRESSENVLTINGFDVTVPSVIEAFATSMF